MNEKNEYRDNIEIIQQKSENTAGFIAIILLFLDGNSDDKQLLGALKCLSDEIFTIRDLSRMLCDKVFDNIEKGSDINE